jgi:flagellar basal-body rod protein FlgB
MLIRLLDHHGLQTARTALTGLSRRQEATASNIANIDTPGFQRREVTFEDALRRNVDAARGGSKLVRTNERHVDHRPNIAHAMGQTSSHARDVVASRNDANFVSVDEEMTILVETQIRYQALSQTVTQRLGTLRNIIRGA